MRINTKILKETLITRNLTIADLVKETDLSRQTITRALKGYSLTPRTISKLYGALEDVELDDFVDYGD